MKKTCCRNHKDNEIRCLSVNLCNYNLQLHVLHASQLALTKQQKLSFYQNLNLKKYDFQKKKLLQFDVCKIMSIISVFAYLMN